MNWKQLANTIIKKALIAWAAVFALAWPFQMGWNHAVVPATSGLNEISYAQAIVLMVFILLLRPSVTVKNLQLTPPPSNSRLNDIINQWNEMADESRER